MASDLGDPESPSGRGRLFPFLPKSARDLEIGDFWAVELADGRFGAAQVRDLQRSGVGVLTTFVMGVVDWSGSAPPIETDLDGRTVLDQGLARIDVFTRSGAEVLGNCSGTVAGPGLRSAYRDHGVGTVTSVWGWKTIPRVVERTLTDNK